MSDDIDATDVRQQVLLDASIGNISLAAKVSIIGDGSCAVCGNEVEPTLCAGKIIIGRWCSIECRDRVGL
jgi:hypothetical protein